MPLAQEFVLSDPLIRQGHGREITVNYTEQSMFNPLMGSSNDAIIKTELVENNGNITTATMHMRGLVRGDGVEGNTDFDDNMDKLQYLSQDVSYEIFGNAIPSRDRRIESKTAADNFRNDAKDGLSDWARDTSDRIIVSRLSQDCTNIVACNAANGFAAGVNATGAMVAGAFFNTQAIDEAKRRAMMGLDGVNILHPRVRPYILKVSENNGIPVYEKFYVMMVGTMAAAALREDPIWREEQKYAAERGAGHNFFTGQLGIHNGVILVDGGAWTSQYAGIMNSDINAYRGASDMGIYAGNGGLKTEINLFLGATAGLLPMDEGFNYYEEAYDMGRKLKIGADRGWAFQKTRYMGKTTEQQSLVWHGKDYGVIAVVSSMS